MNKTATPTLEMRGITKRFPGVTALQGVNFRLHPGKVHALLGENGAGKSTLMKIIAGLQKADEGKTLLRGKEIVLETPKHALENGIAMIHQELSPVLEMSIMENLFLGKECIHGKIGPINFSEMKRQSTELLGKVGLTINPTLLMRNLSVSQMQMVEIAKALSYDSEIIIMDEPSATITNREVENLFRIIRQLKEEGRCIVYITHKMDEVFTIADEITVFRDGHYIGTYDSDSINKEQIIRLMVDRDLNEIYPTRERSRGDVCLEVKNFCQAGVFENISFSLHKGEILGFSGLMGAGRTEVMNALFGITKPTGGTITINGREIKKHIPRKMISNGIGYITEDRKGNGLVMEMSVQDNTAISSLQRLSNAIGLINWGQITQETADFASKLRIKTPSPHHLVKNLSGGNQQKVILAKWLMVSLDIIIFDEPTRGIDVGAKTEIYRLIAQLAAEGKGIILISSEMPEVLGMCDRIIVLHEGHYSGELDIHEATQEKLLTLATAHQ